MNQGFYEKHYGEPFEIGDSVQVNVDSVGPRNFLSGEVGIIAERIVPGLYRVMILNHISDTAGGTFMISKFMLKKYEG